MKFFICVFAYIFLIEGANCVENITDDQQEDVEIYMNPSSLIKIKERTYHYVEWYTTYTGADHATYSVLDNFVADIISFNETYDITALEGNETGKGSFNVSALFVGLNYINITIYDKDNNTLGIQKLDMTVLLSYAKLNTIFTYILGFLVFCMYVNMGATIDLQTVKKIAIRPVGPLVGVLCQYGFMPIFAFALAKFIFPEDELRQLGMFLNGASPGGGSSNMWTLLLGGSLDLSIMMTFVSTIAAFGTLPLWVLTLGPKIIGEDSVFQIPYDSIAYILISLIFPCGIGLLIQKFLPKVAKFLKEKVIKLFALFNVIFIGTFGIYSYRYVFRLFTWRILVGCFALPGLGYLAGFIMAILTRRTKNEIIAISIETGVQNANIPIIILKFTLGQPIGDLAVVIPACSVLMTPIPLAIALIVKTIYKRISHSGGMDIKSVDEKQKDKENGIINSIALPETAFQAGIADSKKDKNGQIIEDKLFGVSNPAVDLTNEVL